MSRRSNNLVLLGCAALRAALRAHFPMDYLSVCASVGLSSAWWKNDGSDPDAVWRFISDGFRDEAAIVGFGIGPREGVLWGTNLGRVIVTNGDFTAYVCDSSATRSSSQITLDRLVIIRIIYLFIFGVLLYEIDIKYIGTE